MNDPEENLVLLKCCDCCFCGCCGFDRDADWMLDWISCCKACLLGLTETWAVAEMLLFCLDP
jgi:hypothetical protein